MATCDDLRFGIGTGTLRADACEQQRLEPMLVSNNGYGSWAHF